MENKVKLESCIGVRHVQAILMFLAMVLAICMRVNISLAIVDMTDSTKEHYCAWSVQKQSVVLSSFFWGYIVLQVPGGMVAGQFGAKWPLFGIILFNSIVCFAIPLAADYGGWKLVCVCRVLQGLVQGSVYPCIYNLIAKWVPKEEKNRIGAFVYAGAHLGIAVQSMYAGFLASALGWEYIFYVNGIFGVIWSVIYFFFGASSPGSHKTISYSERMYIETSIGSVPQSKRYSAPWRAMLTSLPFLAVLVAHIGENWGFYTLMTMMPSYWKLVLGVNIQKNGVISAIPYLVLYLANFPIGYVVDFVSNRKLISLTAVRKLSNTVGFWGPAAALIWMSYSPAGNVTAAVALISLVLGLNAGHFTGYGLSHIDMAPNFAGVMMGITNTGGGVASLIAPLAAGALLEDETSPDDWRKVFYLASFIFFITNLVYVIFGSCERQTWNEHTADKKKVDDNSADV